MLDWYLIWMLFYWNVPGNCNFLPICFGTCAFVPEELMMDLLLVWVEYPPYQIKALKLARACGVPAVGVWVVDCWQWLSGHYCHHSFHIFFFSVTTFSHRSARITKLISQKLFRLPKNLGIDTFPDPISHFGAPWWQFLILKAVRRCRRWASAPFAARLVLVFVNVWFVVWRRCYNKKM